MNKSIEEKQEDRQIFKWVCKVIYLPMFSIIISGNLFYRDIINKHIFLISFISILLYLIVVDKRIEK
ncbi:uncharacterized protein CBO05P1_235 [Clostridium botulinum B str. Osaka05]|uniref:Uncharacterized protein n=1 Tax=Clostridium botulinum B str. Osaka05 TaxID=1407017 RepID=A0A060N9L5_CLOBO|nr:hypothetical protein [Clostridium botulinum]BAO04954.1 uncharacterized protein CBO05P1_235 [Clostridium botulinum B str. Osaka05]